MIEKVYALQEVDDECGCWTMSIYKTKIVAFKALRTTLLNQYILWRELDLRYGKPKFGARKFGKKYRIKEFDLIT